MSKNGLGTPTDFVSGMGAEMNEVMPKMQFAIEQARERFDQAELIVLVVRDKEASRSLICAVPKADFLNSETCDAFFANSKKYRETPMFAQLTTQPGDGFTWAIGYNGKDYWSWRIGLADNHARLAVPGMCNEELRDAELLRLSLACWNARKTVNDGIVREGAALAKAVALGHTPLPASFGPHFAETWADGGYSRIVTTHKFASALMCSRVVGNDVSDIHIPWMSFQVAVPNGLIVRPDNGEEYDRIACMVDGERSTMAMYSATGRTTWLLLVLPTSEIFAPDTGVDNEERIDDVTARVALLARRLVAGVLLTLDQTASLRGKSGSRGGERNVRDEPRHRVYSCGRPITVDCRPAVRQFLSGGGKSPASVQTLVRGHYKRQVVGTGREGRKVVWIEPYWRGPEDAPILARPYKIGTDR